MIKKTFKKKTSATTSQPSRITNSTIDEHREAVLSQGRKFKYPIQYAKHKLVINTIIIGVIAIVSVSIFGWFQLYKSQSTGDIAYRVTQFLSLPVATIDGQKVLYSDYLMQYRSSVTVIERQEGKLEDTEDNRRRLDHYKRVAMDNSEVNAYALKLAKEYNIHITRERIDQVFAEHRMSSGGVEVSEESFTKIIRDNYGLSKSEYERMFIELPLIHQEVQVVIDENAKTLANSIGEELNSDGSNFDAIADKYKDQIGLESSGGLISSSNLDGGRAAKAYQMKKGQVSDAFLSKTGDAYYFVKLLDKQEEKVQYLSIKIPLTELQDRVRSLCVEGKIKEHIALAIERTCE